MQDNADRKAFFFTGATLGPDDPQFPQYSFFANVEVFGLLDSRPDDRMGVGVWWNGLSDNFTDLVSPVADLRNNYGVEMYYNFAVTKWLHIGPDLQFIENAIDDDDLAVIPGIRLVIDF